MQTYQEVFAFYEETTLHVCIAEVEEAEAKYRRAVENLSKLLNQTTIEELDQIFGIICRSYEMQGFAFAQSVYDIKDGWIKTSPKTAGQVKSVTESRPIQTNENRRIITSHGITQTATEWKDYLQCSWGTLYRHLNKGQEHFDEWVSQKIPVLNGKSKTVNGMTKAGYPCRYIESNGMRMNCTEWIKFLRCSGKPFYEKLRQGEDVLDEWITQRLMFQAAKV